MREAKEGPGKRDKPIQNKARQGARDKRRNGAYLEHGRVSPIAQLVSTKHVAIHVIRCVSNGLYILHLFFLLSLPSASMPSLVTTHSAPILTTPVSFAPLRPSPAHVQFSTAQGSHASF